MKLGSIISIWLGFYWHKGVVTSVWPRILVTHNSKSLGYVIEEPFPAFAQGQSVGVEWTPCSYAAFAVVERARECLGQKYKIREFNCDHHTEYAKTGKPDSPQLAAWVGLGILGGLVLIASAAGR